MQLFVFGLFFMIASQLGCGVLIASSYLMNLRPAHLTVYTDDLLQKFHDSYETSIITRNREQPDFDRLCNIRYVSFERPNDEIYELAHINNGGECILGIESLCARG